jgi:hypothetical protein
LNKKTKKEISLISIDINIPKSKENYNFKKENHQDNESIDYNANTFSSKEDI